MVEFSQRRFEAALQVVQSCGALPAIEPYVIALHVFDTLASTNQTAWALSDRAHTISPSQEAPSIAAVIALQQAAGRGQWGKQWVSSPGGLYLSVVLKPDLAIEHAAQLTLCPAWGIVIALRKIPGILSGVATEIPVQLKWLNDLVVQGHKLGGILTETRVQQGRINRAVVGVGINWTNAVPAVGINLRSLLEQQPVPLIESLELLTAITLHGLIVGYQRWQQAGIESLLPSYLELMTHRDRPLLLEGRVAKIVGITAAGALHVQFEPSPPTANQPSQGLSTEEVFLKPGTISLGYETLI